MSRKNKGINPNEKNKEIKINPSTGEVTSKDSSGKMLNEMVDNGLAAKVDFGEICTYFINPYAYAFVFEKPNDTLLKMFEGGLYCRRSYCKHNTDYNKREEFCDECRYRVPINKGEFEDVRLRMKFLDQNSKIYFEESEEDVIDEIEKNLTYREYLKTDYWKEFRQKAIEHYNNECNWCSVSGEEVIIHVHHIRYGEWFNEDLNNVILLCSSCHSKAHGKDN